MKYFSIQRKLITHLGSPVTYKDNNILIKSYKNEFYNTDTYKWCQQNIKKGFGIKVNSSNFIDPNNSQLTIKLELYIEINNDEEAILFKLFFGKTFLENNF